MFLHDSISMLPFSHPTTCFKVRCLEVLSCPDSTVLVLLQYSTFVPWCSVRFSAAVILVGYKGKRGTRGTLVWIG